MPVYGTYLGNTGGATSIVTIGQHNNYIYTYCSANGLTKLDIATNTVTRNISNFVGNIRPYNLTIYNGNIYMINNKAEFYRYNISANTYTKELNNIGTGAAEQINGSCFDYPYLYFNNSKGIGRVNITSNPITLADVSLSWGSGAGRSIATDNNGYLYTADLATAASKIQRIDISDPKNPTVFVDGVFQSYLAPVNSAWGLAVYMNYLYVTDEGIGEVHRYRLTDPATTNEREYGNSKTNPLLATGLCQITPYKGNLYAAYYNSISSIGRFALPIYPDPSNISIDDGNTYTVASGNVQVSIADGLNGTIYATRYWYSIDGGVTYIRTRTGPSGSATTYPRFYIPGLPFGKKTIYVYAKHDAGNSAPVIANVFVLTTPNSISNCSVSSIGVGNINVSITETSPPTDYYLNNVSYRYYLYTGGQNQFANGLAYTFGANMDPSYNASFVINNLPTNNYRVYLIAQNSFGNTASATSFFANVTVYTPPSSISFNTGNTSIVTPGNLKVTVNDVSNSVTNGIYYWYSIDGGATYANSTVPNNGPTKTTYTFYVTYNPTAIQPIYVKAQNPVGTSNLIFVNVNSPYNPYLYLSNNLQLQNGITNYSFYLPNLTNKVYPLYLNAKNTLGYSANSAPYNVTVYTTPLATLSFDTGNIKTVSGGNLQVRLIDLSNTSLNGVYYQYSINGNAYISSNVYSGTSPYTFYIAPTNPILDISNTIYVKATNPVGNSSPEISLPAIVYQIPRKPPQVTFELVQSGNVRVTIVESAATPEIPYYYLNNVSYSLYAYNTFGGNNLSGNTSSAIYNYSAGILSNTNSSYSNVVSYVNAGLNANTYTMYVIAKNPFGNSTPFSANIAVYTTPDFPPKIDTTNTISATAGNLTVSITDPSNNTRNAISYWYYVFDPSSTGTNDSGNVLAYSNTGATLTTGAQQSFLLTGYTNKTYTLYLLSKNPVGNSTPSFAAVTIYTVPNMPTRFDSGNTITVQNSSGNLKVSFFDTSNASLNNVYYWYSTNGTLYSNTNIKNTNSTNPYSFFVYPLTNIQSPIYIRASNTVGNSTPLTQTFTVLQTPRAPPVFIANLVDSGNVLLTVRETNDVSPRPDNYYLNGVSYYYYLYTNGVGNNLSANLQAYTNLVGNLNSSGYPDTELLVTGLSTSTMTFYVVAKNDVGYSNTVSANVTVYTAPNSFSFDSGNTKTVSSGNLRVSFIDQYNSTANGVYYKYSTDGTNYDNANILSIGSSIYQFYIPGLLNASYTISLIAQNAVGCTAPVSITTTVFTTPQYAPMIDTANTNSTTSGNLTVSILDSSNSVINGIYYLYSMDGIAYGNSRVAKTSTATNYQFTINNTGNAQIPLIGNVYSLTVAASNTVGTIYSNAYAVNVYTTPLVPSIDAGNTKSTTSGNLTVSVNDNVNSSTNGIYYLYSTDGITYGNSGVAKTSTATNYKFTINNTGNSQIPLIGNVYSLYIKVENPTGNAITPSFPVNVYTFPLVPSIDAGNTKSTTSGNLTVSVNDSSNSSTNGLYYLYSTDGITYGNSRVAKISGISKYMFDINNTGNAQIPLIGNVYSLYIKVENPTGNAVSTPFTVNVYTFPLVPFIDAGNTKSTTSGNLTVSINDNVNSSTNGIYYLYSTDGITYGNSGVAKISGISKYMFDINNTGNSQIPLIGNVYSLYIKVENPTGNAISNPLSVNVYTTPLVPSFDAGNTKSTTAGNLTVSIRDTSNKAINNIYYFYSTDGGNTYANTFVKNTDSMEPYTFSITSLPTIQSNISVRASNTVGNSIPAAQTFTVYQIPRTPPYFAATLIDSGNVLLTVRETNDVSPRPENYYLNKVSYYYYLYTDGVGANDSANIGAYTSLMGNVTNPAYPDTSIYVSGLPNATSTFYVIAKNTVGYSGAISANVTVYNAPSNITIDTGNTRLVSSGNVKVVIYDPNNTTANNVYYKYSLDESTIPYIATNVQKRDGDSRPYFYIDGLSAGTYPVLVSAYNTVGNTDIAYTTVVSYTTPTNITLDVSNTSVVSSGNLKIVLTDPTNADIDNVYYWYSLNGSTYANSRVKATTPAASSYTFTVTGLTDISYSVSVIAKNPIGNSAVATIPKIVYTTPVSPTAYSVAFVESGNIRAEFTDINANPDYESNEVSYWYYLYNGVVSENNLSSIVSAYTPTNIQYSKSISTSAFYIDQLAANQYTLYLYAKNKVGNSPIISSTLSVYTNPSPPTSVSISTNSAGTIQVSIVDASNTAINNVYYYYYLYSAGEINDSGNTAAYTNSNTQYVSSASTFNIPGLSPNNYTVYIRTKNVVGYSTSIVSSSLTVFTVPLTPQIDAANTTSTNGNEITVTIIDTSNSAINNVYYHYSIDNGQTYSNTKVRYTGVASQNRYSYVITAGLYNSQEYTVYTIAKNIRGSSAPIVSGSILVYSTPNQPVIVVTPTDSMIDIAITPPANNGNAISGYAYLVSPGIGTYTNIGIPVNNRFSIPDLQNGTLYSVRVIAINARGNSPPSAAVSAKPFGLSAAPNIYAKYRNNIVDVSFDTPDSNGAEITNYRFSLNGEFPTTGNVGVPPDNYFSIRYLTAGNTYALRLYSESILGLSAPSNTITLTPGRVPDEPFIINTVPLDAAIEIELLPGFNGGSSIIGYTYAYIEGSL